MRFRHPCPLASPRLPLPARQRDGRAHQLERGVQHGQAATGAAEPGQLYQASRAGRVAIGRHDQAIDGGEQTKKTGEHDGQNRAPKTGRGGIVPAPAPRVLLWVLRERRPPSPVCAEARQVAASRWRCVPSVDWQLSQPARL